MSIKLKMLLPMVALTIATTIAILATCIFRFTSYMTTSVQAELNTGSDVVNAEVENYKIMATQASHIMAKSEEIVDALTSGDKQELLKRATILQQAFGVDFCTISDSSGIVLARTHQPDAIGDSVTNQANVASAIAGKSIATIETGTQVPISVRAGTPAYDHNNKIVGVISVGYRLDDHKFVDRMAAMTGTEVTVFVEDERLSTTVMKDGVRAVGTKATSAVWQQVSSGVPYVGSAQILDNNANVKYTPIVENNKTIGMLFVGLYTAHNEAEVRSFIFIGISVGVIILIISAVIGNSITNRIVSPILQLSKIANNIAAGEIDIDINITSNDEIFQLAESLNAVIKGNQKQAHVIEEIANGNLCAHLEVRSERDIVGNALNKMIDANNHAFLQIRKTSQKVAEGSKQISAGAIMLAEGATVQSETIENISESVRDISEKAQQNTQLVTEAEKLGAKIIESTTKGTQQMQQLHKSVKEISDASYAINDVIKIIEDIAFQTNILALNAAVEAAHAAQHGKGFAVVADEVGRLAKKSADAAKNTSELISNTIEKARAGTIIADSTSRSLAEIVNGIEKNSEIVGNIALSSKKQTLAISQINNSIGQVAGIIEENSATSEESAAFSQTLSHEAGVLENLVSHFKLNDSSTSRKEETGFALV